MLRKHEWKKNSMIFLISVPILMVFADSSSCTECFCLQPLHLLALLCTRNWDLDTWRRCLPLHGSSPSNPNMCWFPMLCQRRLLQPLSLAVFSFTWLTPKSFFRSQLKDQFLLTTFPDVPCPLIYDIQPIWNSCLSPVSHLDSKLQARKALPAILTTASLVPKSLQLQRRWSNIRLIFWCLIT